MTVPEYNLQEVVTESRVRGLWRLMHGFRFIYLVANLAVGVAALSRSAFAYLIRYLVDDVLGTPQAGRLLPWVALGFIGLALLQGAFTFLSGKLA
ncbi:MAG: ABC transporter ATP-binding protein, partial [Chloroflexi bacterium]|nr:ABC transporter ATP-binding protein [Chloroflexota bacterium]